MEPLGWVALTFASIAVGLSKGGLHMVSMISVPIMSLVMSPVQAAGMLLPLYVISDIGGLAAFRRSFDKAVLLSMLPGGIVGIWLGYFTASIVSEGMITVLVGLIGLIFALNKLLRRNASGEKAQVSQLRGNFWGGLAGYTSFVSHAGSPPMQVYVQPLGLSALAFAATAQWFFAIANLIKLVPYAMLGQLSLTNIWPIIYMIPIAFASVWAGLKLVQIIPQELFYKLITWALLLISLRLIWQGAAMA